MGVSQGASYEGLVKVVVDGRQKVTGESTLAHTYAFDATPTLILFSGDFIRSPPKGHHDYRLEVHVIDVGFVRAPQCRSSRRWIW